MTDQAIFVAFRLFLDLHVFDAFYAPTPCLILSIWTLCTIKPTGCDKTLVYLLNMFRALLCPSSGLH
jgi:hypothetical protein